MKARLNGLEMYWEKHGPQGTPIVLIHGFPFSSAMWAPQIEALGKDLPLIAYDLRGFGASEASREAFHFEAFVEDLEALLAHAGLSRAILCGLSMGGYVALRFAEKNPSRVAGLALLATRSDADDDAAKLKRAATAESIRRHGVPVYAEGFLKAVFARGAAESEVDRVRRIIVGNPLGSIVAGTVALATRTDTTAALSGFRFPSLVMVGTADTVTPPELARGMASRLQGSKLVELEGAAHMLNLERPAEVNAALRELAAKC